MLQDLGLGARGYRSVGVHLPVRVVVHLHCSLSMFNMEKRYRNKIIILNTAPTPI